MNGVYGHDLRLIDSSLALGVTPPDRFRRGSALFNAKLRIDRLSRGGQECLFTERTWDPRVAFQPHTDSVGAELRKILDAATPDSVGGDIRRATQLVSAMPEGPERDEAEEFLTSLERLAYWLQDR